MKYIFGNKILYNWLVDLCYANHQKVKDALWEESTVEDLKDAIVEQVRISLEGTKR